MATYQLIAATGCPTGIAHTYMAQEALEQAAKRKGITIKVETHGQIGIENELTPAEIQGAEAVIIAADKDVQAERFAGKRIIDVPVSVGIKEADRLIEEALAGKGSIAAENQAVDELEQETQISSGNVGHSIYKNLMNGVSHMLPFVVAGGVLIALSFAIWGIYSFDPESSQYNATAAMLKSIGDASMGMMVPILSAYIAEGIAKRPGFLAGYFILLLQRVFKGLPKSLDGLKAIFLYPVIGVAVIGITMSLLADPMKAVNEGMMSFLASFQNSSPLVLGIIVGCMCAFDMGGPVNKAAYVTGTALLAQGNTSFMAGVSAACIAPPLITGFATLFFGKYFDTNERNAGLVNFILGSTHITEGAIPFAAKDPLKVLPIMMLGSSIAAVLTYMFGVQVPAPHGGFLVLPVVTHAVQWVLAILAGSLVGGLLLGFVQKSRIAKQEQSLSKK